MNDKFIIFYVKNDITYPVTLSQEQFDMLQLMIPMVFQGKTINVINEPQGTIEYLKGGKFNE